MTNVSLLDAEEFPCGSTGSDIVTAMSQVAAVAQVQSLAQKLQHADGKDKKKKPKTEMYNSIFECCAYLHLYIYKYLHVCKHIYILINTYIYTHLHT